MKLKKSTTNTRKLKRALKPFSSNLTCDYEGNFPWQPQIVHSEVVTTEEQLKRVAKEMKSLSAIAFDTETNTLEVRSDNKKFKCVGISISWGEENNYYIPLGHVRDEDIDNQLTQDVVVKYLKPIFQRKDLKIYGWNLKFDFHVLKRIGISIKTKDVFDGMLASWLCNENAPKGLKENSMHKMGIAQTHFAEATATVPSEVKKQFGYKANNKVPFDLVLIEEGAPYAIADAFYTWCCCIGYEQELQDEKMWDIYHKMYAPFLFVLFDMEEQGVTIDIERLKEMGEEMQEDLEELQYQIYELAGIEFNITSSQQKAEILFGYEKPPTKTGKDTCNYNILEKSFGFSPTTFTKSGAPSTDNDAIWRISQKSFKNKRKNQGVEMCSKMLEYGRLNKLKTAFVDGLLDQLYDDNKVHPSFNQVGCLTEETLIPTDEGLYPIKELANLSTDGEFVPKELNIVNRYRTKEKTAYVVKYEKRDTTKITTRLGFTIEGSNKHPIIVNKYTRSELYSNINSCYSKKRYLGAEVFTRLDEITEDSYIAIPYGYNTFSEKLVELKYDNISYTNHVKKGVKLPSVLDSDLAEFLGIYYADGSIHDNTGSFSIRITNGNKDVRDRTKYLSEKLFNVEAQYRGEPEKNSGTTYITSKVLEQIEDVLEMKRGCVNKIIPSIILRSPREVVISFIRGLTLDSHLVLEKTERKLVFVLSNEISARYLQEILLNLGIISSRTQDNSKSDNVFLVSLTNDNYLLFRDIIGFIESEKIIDFESERVNSNYRVDTERKTVWVGVKSIEKGIKDVYDFNVPQTHSFISGAFISHNTDSGRLSCSSPNLQQLPKASDEDKYQIRSVFIGGIDKKSGERKKIIAIDYHNLEMVVLTYFSDDKCLTEMFANDDDAHGSTAVNTFDLDCTPVECKKKYPHFRQVGKTLNFLLMYGGGASLLYDRLKSDHYSPLDLGAKEYLEQYHCKNGKEVAQSIIDKYFETYNGVAKFIKSQKKYAHKHGHVYTVLGRKRRLPDINSSDMGKMSYCERLSVNSTVQGTAGDITINAQLRVASESKLKKLGCEMLIQVHDELVFECPEENLEEAIKIIKYDMEHPFGDDPNKQIPFLRADYDTGNSYQEAK